MTLNKYSSQSDAVANLYKAALYLARGSKAVGIEFLVKARDKLGDRLDQEIKSLIDNKEKLLKGRQNQLFWAEKILDQYHKFK